MFCTEVLEVFEAADKVHVVSQGRLLPSLEVGGFDQVEQLATAVMALEQSGRPEAA